MSAKTFHVPSVRPFVVLVLTLVLASLISSIPAYAVSPNIVISQVYGGGGNGGATLKNDFVELFNRGTTSVNITGWSVQYASSAGTTWAVTALSGTLAPGQYFLIQEAQGAGGTTNLPTPDATGTIAMSATAGKVALVNSTTALTGSGCPFGASVVDFVGYGTAANCFEGATTPTLSNTTAAIRNANGCADTDSNVANFAVAAPTPRNTSSPLFVCPVSTNPSGTGTASPNAIFAGGSTQLSVTVTPGSNPTSTGIAVTGNLSAIGGSNAQAFTNAGNNTFTFQATVTGNPGSKSLPITISDAQGRTGSASISLTVLPAPIAIHTIQGAGHLSPNNGQLVTTLPAIVTALRTTGSTRGFYIQDPNPDADLATSEGIFVFTGGSSNPATMVTVGDKVYVSGNVSEYRPSTAPASLTLTELVSPINVIKVSSGTTLPAAVIIGTGGRVPPAMVIEDDASDVDTNGVFDPASDGIDFYESLEGMLVQVNNAVAVGPTSDFTSNHEIPVVGNNGANASVRTTRGGIIIRSNDYNPERIILNDWISGGPTLPAANVGASFPGAVMGVIDYSFNNFKLQVTSMPTIVASSLTREVAASSPTYQLSVGAFNVENLAPSNPASKFSTLAGLIVNNLKSPDVVAIEEIQDNSGAIDNGIVGATTTWTMLINAITTAGGPAYQYRQIDPVNNQDGGAPGSNIRQGFLFRTDRGLTFVDRPGGTSTNSTGVTGSGVSAQLTFSPGRIDPTNGAFSTSRKPLAGEFVFKGDKVFVIANHWNSKGGDQPLFGHFQPPALSSEAQRNQQATVVKNFVSSILAADANANVVVLGDLNDFEFSNPLNTLKSTPLNALIETLPQSERYTYVFEGNSQTLDHTLVSNGIFARPRAFDVVHVNSEFATQASDHEPQVSLLCVDRTAPSISVSATPSELWPANHKYVNVKTTVTKSDNADPNPTVTLVSVTSNEPDNGLGDGDTPNDIVKVNDYTFNLRAERSGTGTGRVYILTYKASDACGNSKTASATVTVPHDKGK